MRLLSNNAGNSIPNPSTKTDEGGVPVGRTNSAVYTHGIQYGCNMGVDFAAPVEKKSNAQQIESVPQEKKSKQDQEFIDIDEGVQPARTMRCPHCGQEIVL